MADSPRWCERCDRYGNHHTDRHELFVRYARINAPKYAVEAYLPRNYQVVSVESASVIISGVDDAGWTLDGYVLPRLASGLYFGKEIDAEAATVELA